MRGTKPTAGTHPPPPPPRVRPPPPPPAGGGGLDRVADSPLSRTAGVKELSIFSISASPAKAGAHRSAARTDLRWRIAIALEIPNGGGGGPGFRRGSEGESCRL